MAMSRTIQALKFGNDTIYIEVSEVAQEGVIKIDDDDELEKINALDDVINTGQQLVAAIRGLVGAVKSGLDEAKPKEWTLEINLGFKGKAGIPFITEGEANGAVKVTAKWVNP